MLLVSAAVVACLGVVQVCAIYTPKPYTPPPPPQPAASCSDIYISTTGTCSLGSRLATDVDVSLCMADICAAMDVWSKAAYANPSMMIVGAGYDATCGPLTKDGDLGDAVCVSSSHPTPQPYTPPPPAGNCSGIDIQPALHENSTCDAGSRLATEEDVSLCMHAICPLLGTWGVASYAVPNMVILGKGHEATCDITTASERPGEMVCVSSSAPPPTPQPAGDCSGIYIGTASTYHLGSRLATAEEVSLCMHTICALMDRWGMSGYAVPNMVVAGSGFQFPNCGVETYTGTPWHMVFMSSVSGHTK